MARARSRIRILGTFAVLAVLLPLTGGGAVATDSPSAFDPTTTRGRAGKLIAGLAERAVGSQPSQASTPTTSPTRAASLAPSSGEQSAAGASGICDSRYVWPTLLTDRTIVRTGYPGAASLLLQRQRMYGAWINVGTATGESAMFNDTGINAKTVYAYRLVARNSAGSVLHECQTEYLHFWSDDGLGGFDAIVGHDAGLFQQGEWAPGESVADGTWVTPAFSADGRLVAATRIDVTTGQGILEVRRARTGTPVFSVDLGVDVSVADPAFSRDGQTLAYSRYATETGEPLGIGFVDVHGSHTPRALNANVPMAEPAWRPNGTLVVTAFGAQAALASICPTCTTATPIPGTAGGYTAEVAPDGSVYFAVTGETTSELKKVTPTGSVATLRSSTGDIYTTPRLTTDGRLFVQRDIPNESAPQYPGVSIDRVRPSGAADDESTAIAQVGVYGLTYGYDVRQLVSPGTSSFVHEAHDDIVARDAYGKLWAYRNTGWGLGARTQIGSGWSSYSAIVAAGDMTSDGRADLIGRDAYGKLWLYPGLGNGRFGARFQIGSGWNPYTLVGSGDWSGDDKADLLARDALGYLWMYPGTGTGRLGARVLIGRGWNGMNLILGSGDANFDSTADLISRDTYGRLWLYPGNGKGGFQSRRQIGQGWGGFTAITVTEVTNQRALVWARTSAGRLVYYELYADGTFNTGQYQLGYGWNGLLITS